MNYLMLDTASGNSTPTGLTLRVALAFSLVAALLGGCATTTTPLPNFPPHLGYLAVHPFYTEECHVKPGFLSITSISFNVAKKGSPPAPSAYDPNYAQVQKQRRCQWLNDDLQRQIAYADQQFRENNRCVSRVYEVNGQMQSDTRECRYVQEGRNALSRSQSRPSY